MEVALLHKEHLGTSWNFWEHLGSSRNIWEGTLEPICWMDGLDIYISLRTVFGEHYDT